MLDTIEHKVDALIQRCAELEKEAATLREKEAHWEEERARLVEKNEKARTRVEAMISHLKSLASEAEQRAS